VPLTVPPLDNRTYDELLDEALARIPVHNPEWTNFNESDPGVTLVEVFAFLAESLLYRANQIPERNRRKFLTLLGVPLQPASSARGMVTFSNDRLPPTTLTLNSGVEVRAGQVPFRTERGLDVLPLEARLFYKQPLQAPDDQLTAYYKQLYASYLGDPPAVTEPVLYRTLPLPDPSAREAGINLGQTVDGSVWLALLVRPVDKPYDLGVAAVRRAIAGKTLSLGIVPSLVNAQRVLAPTGANTTDGLDTLQYELPRLLDGGVLPRRARDRVARYQTVGSASEVNVLAEPGVVQITLPSDPAALALWANLDPLESGVADFPPALDDTTLNNRLVTWLRISSPAAIKPRLLFVGANAAMVVQRAHVANEQLPAGTGEPDQLVTLSNTPVVADSVQLSIVLNGRPETWRPIEDLLTAAPEVPVPDVRLAPGAPGTGSAQASGAPSQNAESANVFEVEAESGALRFGDGTRGRRPPQGAVLRAAYDYAVGPAGNVGPGSINAGPALPGGIKVSNPVRTWGGAPGESVEQGEKQVRRYLQHRDRLVVASDFETIALRTPGVDIARVEVVPAFTPELPRTDPGDTPGTVTLMVIPSSDPGQPDAPQPDRLFVDALVSYLEPRRLVATELIVCGPNYREIWVSVGVDVMAGTSTAQVREAVKQAVRTFLAPLPSPPSALLEQEMAFLTAAETARRQKGYPLRKAVVARELAAVASRVPGVQQVNDVLLGLGSGGNVAQIGMSGLDLPRVVGISCTPGDPQSLEQLRGQQAPALTTGTTSPRSTVPVPVIPEECR
jgi:baseplate J-like protein